MERRTRSAVLGVAMIGLLAGCGSGGSGGAHTISGTVRDARGQALAGVAIALEHRLTDEGALVQSLADGTYRAQVAPGVYDARLVDEAAPGTAAGTFGPIAIRTDLQRDFVLHEADPADPGRVSGRLVSRPGTSLAHRRVRLLPATAISRDPAVPATVPPPVETTTDGDGRFAVSLGTDQEIGFDLEIYEADGALDEFVDIIKPAGAMTVELASEYVATENRHRVSQGDVAPDRPAPPARASFAAGLVRQALADSRFVPFDLRVIRDEGFGADAVLEHGTLPPDDLTYFWTHLLGRTRIEGHESLEVLFFDGVPIDRRPERPRLRHLTAAGARFDLIYRYRVQVLSKGIVTFRFVDDTGDSYALRIYVDGWHHVSFNSARPDLRTIHVSEGLF